MLPNDKKTTGERYNYFEIVLRLVLVLALVSASTVAITYFDILELSDNFNAGFLVGAVIFQILFWILSTYCWQKIVSITTSTHLVFNDCLVQNALLLVGKYIPGKVWGLIVRGHRLKKHGIEMNGSIQATYFEQINSTHAGFVFGITCWVLAIDYQWRWLAIVLALTSLVVLPLCHGRVLRYLLSNSPEKWKNRLQNYAVLDISIRDYLLMACLYQIEWLLLGIIAVFIYMAMTGGIPLAHVAILLIGSNTIGMVVGFIALFAPAGIGVREAVNAGILLNTLTVSEVTGFVILLRSWSVSADIIIGSIAMILSRKNAE